MISIRRSSKKDLPAVMDFIATHWRSDHVLAKNRSLMVWQHCYEDECNYMLATDGDVLVGVLGYIPSRRFDDELSTKSNIVWLALWKVRDDYQSSMLGLKLLKALESLEPNSVMAVNGINLDHPPMYKALGFQVYELGQFYLSNPNKPQTIIQKPKNLSLAIAIPGHAILERIDNYDLDNIRASHLKTSVFKTIEYFRKRFTLHPFYDYKLHWIYLDGSLRAAIASRIAVHNSSRVLRIVDFIGDPDVLTHCGSAFQKLMDERSVEYMDFWQYGICSSVLMRAGFHKVDPNGKLVCPNYFEPFTAKNGRILCCIKGSLEKSFIICRADGDQDRPNQL